MGDNDTTESAISVPVDVRSHEHAQLREMLPKAAASLADAASGSGKLQERADAIERIATEHVYDTPERGYVSMTADDWRTTIRGLRRIDDSEGLRSWWLRKKLAERLDDRMEELQS